MIYDKSSKNNKSIFGGPSAIMEGTLKDPNQYRNAVIFEHLNSMSPQKKNEFVTSEEAKVMIKENMISADTVDKIRDGGILMNTTVCHIAMENADPLWDKLVEYRSQERRVMNELMSKYGEQAKPIAESAYKDYVEKYVPEYFRH